MIKLSENQNQSISITAFLSNQTQHRPKIKTLTPGREFWLDSQLVPSKRDTGTTTWLIFFFLKNKEPAQQCFRFSLDELNSILSRSPKHKKQAGKTSCKGTTPFIASSSEENCAQNNEWGWTSETTTLGSEGRENFYLFEEREPERNWNGVEMPRLDAYNRIERESLIESIKSSPRF